MAVPKKRTSSSRKNMRRSHHALNQIKVIECSNCSSEKLPHHICMSCGHYKGKLVINVKSD